AKNLELQAEPQNFHQKASNRNLRNKHHSQATAYRTASQAPQIHSFLLISKGPLHIFPVSLCTSPILPPNKNPFPNRNTNLQSGDRGWRQDAPPHTLCPK